MKHTSDPNIEMAFLHIPKTAGTFVTHVLRSIYGLSHVDLLAHRSGSDATPSWDSALSVDEVGLSLRLNLRTRSIAGHYLLPTPELRECFPNAKWFSVFRNPVKRLISDYRHKCQILGEVVSFEEWIAKRVNLQIRMLVGTEKVEHCIEMVESGHLFVLNQAELNQSLIHFFNFDGSTIYWENRY